MSADQTQFAPGDSDYDIARKILFTLGAVMNDPANDPRPGDTMAVLLRKILVRILSVLADSVTNQRAGEVTLTDGTVTVLDTTVTPNTKVLLTRHTAGGTLGTNITYTTSAGVGFTVNSDSPLDTSTFTYLLIEVV